MRGEDQGRGGRGDHPHDRPSRQAFGPMPRVWQAGEAPRVAGQGLLRRSRPNTAEVGGSSPPLPTSELSPVEPHIRSHGRLSDNPSGAVYPDKITTSSRADAAGGPWSAIGGKSP